MCTWQSVSKVPKETEWSRRKKYLVKILFVDETT